MDKDLEKVMNGEPVKVYALQSIEYGWLTTSIYAEADGRVCIGEAEVIFDLVNKNEAIQKAAEMLDQKIKDTYANAEREVNKIRDQKSMLLALTNSLKND